MVLNEAAARLGVSLRQSEDVLCRDVLVSTAAFINATNGTNGDMPTNLSRQDVNTVVQTLLGNNAYTILDNIEGENRFLTSPIRDSYFAMCNTDLTSNFDGVTGFVQKNSYASPTNALRSEWGAIGNLRFLTSSIGAKLQNASMLGASVYPIIVTGMEGYATVEQNGYSASFIYLPPTIVGGSLALYSSAGYKYAEVSRVLNDEWVLSLRVTLA